MARKARRPGRGKTLRCSKGYSFKRLGKNRVALMRRRINLGVTFQCECDLTGGCKVTIDPVHPEIITCLNDGCSGSCGWVIRFGAIRGLTARL